MNIIIFPFHDMRKNQREGFRNRDSHFIEGIERHPHVEKVLVVNRPFSLLELLYKRTSWKTEGKPVIQGKNYQVVQVNEKTFVLDFLSFDLLGVLLLKKAWFWKAYRLPSFVQVLQKVISQLQLSSYNILVQNIFSYQAVAELMPQKVIFDADDNWLRFPFFAHLRQQVDQSYAAYAKLADHWITNSEENKAFFSGKYNLTSIETIRNGVDKGKFARTYPMPTDLERLPKPIIGFGGSVSHLIDTDLLNQALENHPDKSFVFIGPVIDKQVFSRIKDFGNFYYLGDKHYNQYPAYITHFDLCFIPYHTGNRTHGGDAIKFYEFLAAGKKVISSNGNGIFKANNNIFIADNTEAFSRFIQQAIEMDAEAYSLPEELTWDFKVNLLLSKF